MDFLLYVILGFEESSIIHHFCLENEMSFWSPDYFRWRSLLVSGIVSGQGLIFDLTSPNHPSHVKMHLLAMPSHITSDI